MLKYKEYNLIVEKRIGQIISNIEVVYSLDIITTSHSFDRSRGLRVDLQDYDNALPWTYQHAQEPDDDEGCTLVNMDYKYAHDDKPMLILRNMVGNARPVETIQVTKYKNEDLGFTFRKI